MTTTPRLRTVLLFAVAATALGYAPLPASAADKCVFTKDITLGYEGEEVRCLQKYLNANGYIVAATGVGSTGKETTQYKALTQAAVKQWQLANEILPATGVFGAKSRAKYAALTAVSTPTTPATPTIPTTPSVPVVTPTTSLESQTRDALIKARESLNEIEDDIQEADDDGDDVGDAKEYYEKAVDELFDALIYFLKREYTNALDSSMSLTKEIRNARNEIRDNIDEEDKAKEAISDADDAIDEAQEAIDKADDKGKNVKDAEELLDDAKNARDKAKKALRNDDFDQAYDQAKKAEKYAEDAQDEV